MALARVEPSNIYSLTGIGIDVIRFFSWLLRRINVKVPIWATSWEKYDSPSVSKHMIESARAITGSTFLVVELYSYVRFWG
ncbi:hypothetical protein MUP77_21595 [Candidatus Bathyarchaeota archaeon]|nr:hypothetical protein [Candidatus Bathyarchaeota archaeon]